MPLEDAQASASKARPFNAAGHVSPGSGRHALASIRYAGRRERSFIDGCPPLRAPTGAAARVRRAGPGRAQAPISDAPDAAARHVRFYC